MIFQPKSKLPERNWRANMAAKTKARKKGTEIGDFHLFTLCPALGEKTKATTTRN
jgi:hypothetical protein